MKNEQQKNMKMWGMWGGIILVLALGVWGLAKLDSGPSVPEIDISLREVSPDEHIKGNPNAETTIIEYSDFECPACKAEAPLINQFLEKRGDEVRFVYRHFPLISAHANARMAAKASEAAARQGKFWEMHDKLFEEQANWEDGKMDKGEAQEAFVGYAQGLGMDPEQFRADMNSEEIEKKVDAHRASALKAGLRSTPSIIVDGVLVDTPRTVRQFEKLLEAEEL